MDWRGWVRKILDWLGIVAPAKVQNDVVETAVSQPQPETSSLAKSTTAFGLRLVKVGPDRESVIHLLHEISGMSLRQVRILVDSAPAHVLQKIDAHTGRAVQKRLESLGAVCELVGGVPDSAGRPDSAEPPDSVGRPDSAEWPDSAERPDDVPDSVGQPTHPDNTFFLFGDYHVVLQDAGPQPDRVIRILRDLLNSRTLAEVERMVADTPRQIVRQVPLETAETIKIRLERIGAAVEILWRNHNE